MLFYPEVVKLKDIDHDIYKLITQKAELETQLQLRLVSKGFQELVKEVNPRLFKQLIEEGHYKHLFIDKFHCETLTEFIVKLQKLPQEFRALYTENLRI